MRKPEVMVLLRITCFYSASLILKSASGENDEWLLKDKQSQNCLSWWNMTVKCQEVQFCESSTTWFSSILNFGQYIFPTSHCEAGWWHKYHDAKFPEQVFQETCGDQKADLSPQASHGMVWKPVLISLKSKMQWWIQDMFVDDNYSKTFSLQKSGFQFGQYD